MPHAGTCEGCGKWFSVLKPKRGKWLCYTCRTGK
jgi:hypothetical protein